MKRRLSSLMFIVIIFAGTNLSIAQWQQTGLNNNSVISFAVNGPKIFAGLDRVGAFVSEDEGSSWNPVDFGFTATTVSCFATCDSIVAAGSPDKIFYSYNNGASWSFLNVMNDPLVPKAVYSLYWIGNTIYAATDDGVEIITRSDSGWTGSGSSLPPAFSIAVNYTGIFAGTRDGRIIITTNGSPWSITECDSTKSSVFALALSGSNILAGTDGGGVFLSEDYGSSWRICNSGLTNRNINCLAMNGTCIFAGTEDGVFLSTDRCATWTPMNTGLTSTSVSAMAVSDTYLFAGTRVGRSAAGGVWRRPLSEIVPLSKGTTWTVQNSGVSTALRAVKAVDQSVAWVIGDGGKVLMTTNGGNNWNSVGSGVIGSDDLYAIEALDANTAFVTATSTAGTTFIYRTTNGGTIWEQVFSQYGGFIDGIKMYNANDGIALGDPVDGKWTVLKTDDGGETWDHMANEPLQVDAEFGYAKSLAVSGATNIWFGTNTNRIYHSPDNGTTWSSGLSLHPDIGSIAPAGLHNTLAGSYDGDIIQSTDAGITWESLSELDVKGGTLSGIAGQGKDCFCCAGNTVYRSADTGRSWIASYTGISLLSHLDLVVNGSAISGWTVGSNGTIVAFSGTTTGVENSPADTPAECALQQNYPNPFNPSTIIQFSLSRNGFVRLKVCDVLGREVATLVEENKSAGDYLITWNASGMPSGIYFCHLYVDKFTETRKLLFLR